MALLNLKQLYLFEDTSRDYRFRSFSNEPLKGIDRPQCLFTSCDFRGADLTEANLFESYAPNSDWRQARLVSANLQWLDLTGANMGEVVGFQADLANADLTGSTWTNANLSSATLTGAECRQTDFSGVDFTGADLSNTLMQFCNLSGADLHNAKTDGLVLRYCQLQGVKWGKTDKESIDTRGSTGLNVWLPAPKAKKKAKPRERISA